MMTNHEQIRRIVERQRRENARAAGQKQARLREGREEAQRLCSEFLRDDPDLRLVVLFGSTASGQIRSERFDLDLAVDTDHYSSLWLRAEESAFRVDLVDLSTVSSDFRRRVLQTGRILHGTNR